MKIFLIILLLISSFTVFAQSKSNDIYRKASPAVVLIKTDKGSGTGFIVSRNGIIATALHVIDGASRVAVKTFTGDVFDSVMLLAKDERRDLALLKISGFELPAVNLGNSNDIQPGEYVTVIGNPLGVEQLQTSVSDGIISGIRDLGDGYKVIQITAPISSGNSGGPAFSVNGDVIGVIVFRLREGQSLNFAVPINYLRGMLESLDIKKPISLWNNKLDAESVFSEKTAAKTSRWKSMTTGTIKIVRSDEDYIYIETIVSEEFRKLGITALAELKKQGEKYIGFFRSKHIWWKADSNTGEKFVTETCPYVTSMEITSVTSKRIEGRMLNPVSGAKLNKKTCKYSKPSEWESFVWIPE